MGRLTLLLCAAAASLVLAVEGQCTAAITRVTAEWTEANQDCDLTTNRCQCSLDTAILSICREDFCTAHETCNNMQASRNAIGARCPAGRLATAGLPAAAAVAAALALI
eukprot:TRINITY_DN4875_c0_g1_i2.p2 TRINITY_DN4875_c0_g1~~TRINITY_DN4875_c0_g1_i2.p2  ORF type:complete len:109 (+),score=21.04 TRINITY_DN4875_c0_g1_i2:82-408(+)